MSEYSQDEQLENALKDEDPEIIIEIFHNNWGQDIVAAIPPWNADHNLKLDAWIETLSALGNYIETRRADARPLKGCELYKLALTICKRRLWRLLEKFNKDYEQYDDELGKQDTELSFADVVLDQEAFLQDVDVQLSRLTNKQFEVIRYASENPNATDQKIAESLNVSQKSVESSLRQAREKLDRLRIKWPPKYFAHWLGAIQNEYEKRNE